MAQIIKDPAPIPQTAFARLKALREKTGLSLSGVAKALSKIRGQLVVRSSYAYYETPEFKKRFIPADLASELSQVFAPYGVEAADVMALAGLHQSPKPTSALDSLSLIERVELLERAVFGDRK